ncbi:hypothetical protein EV702DRAFT_1072751 [Suillus placidus]|uniref:Secreted protein n=1 Tax=Suillus placidus TaxID=48579 RepID=A0A9P7D636_9AGAM|nr:hypothetical protein EV702DRAFT_1072751 [Suillus placidus]
MVMPLFYLLVEILVTGPPFGRDPEGCLFYNNLQDFKTQSGSSRYTVTQEKNPADMRDCLRVKFYDGTSGACYAQVSHQLLPTSEFTHYFSRH